MHPMLPLARAMVARGQECGGRLPPVVHVERAGFRAAATGPAGLTRVDDVRAVRAPGTRFGGQEFYPELIDNCRTATSTPPEPHR